MTGIVGYGAHVPSYRIKVEEIAKVWGDDPNSISKGLVVNEKSVPGPDEDTVTIAVEAARRALARAEIDPQDIGAIYVGSESHPYAVKPTASIVAEAVCATPKMTAADLPQSFCYLSELSKISFRSRTSSEIHQRAEMATRV